MKKYDLVQSSESKTITEQIGQLSRSPNWEPFMAWMFRQATSITLTRTDPNPLVALVQQAKLDVIRDIENKINEYTRGNTNG